jgi:hypothetical protein
MQIIRAQISDMQVATNHMTVIPPFSQSLVTCTIQKSETKSYQLPLETAGLTTYEVLNCLVPRMKTLPIASHYDAMNNIMIPISNPTCEDIVIEQVEDIEIWKEEYKVHHMMMYPDVGDLMFSESNHARPAFIEDDLGLNEEEKKMLLWIISPSLNDQNSRRQSNFDGTLFKIYQSSSRSFVRDSI